MYKILTVENMRKSDAYAIEHYVSSRELMLRAGRGVYDKIINLKNQNVILSSAHDKVAIVCGSGNNAGDGFVVANLLHNFGVNVEIVLLKDKFSRDGRYYFEKCLKEDISYHIYQECETFSNYICIIDCILGTGFFGDVRGIAANMIANINKSDSFVISVDINSGLNGNYGTSKLCVKSDYTLSIGGYKTGHFLGISSQVIDKLENIDIGIVPVEKPYLLVDKKEYKSLTPSDFENNIVITSVDDML